MIDVGRLVRLLLGSIHQVINNMSFTIFETSLDQFLISLSNEKINIPFGLHLFLIFRLYHPQYQRDCICLKLFSIDFLKREKISIEKIFCVILHLYYFIITLMC